MQDTVVVCSAVLTRKLLKDGFRIIDIKPDKQDPDRKRSVFVFKNEKNFMDKMRKYTTDKNFDLV